MVTHVADRDSPPPKRTDQRTRLMSNVLADGRSQVGDTPKLSVAIFGILPAVVQRYSRCDHQSMSPGRPDTGIREDPERSQMGVPGATSHVSWTMTVFGGPTRPL